MRSKLRSKKGEKELQMIFGLFILLIITLVVLKLFFKFIEGGTSTIVETQGKIFTQQEIETAKQDCRASCNKITEGNLNDIIEFCGKTIQIDWDGNGRASGKVTWGRWEFCETKVPCFVLVDDCQKSAYTGTQCNIVLKEPNNHRLDYYNALYAGDPDDGCGLDTTNAPDQTSNWKRAFGFDVAP